MPDAKWYTVPMIYTDGIHLISSESLEELHTFAVERIGLKRKWLHNSPRHPHYDLMTDAAVDRALRAGAVMRTSRELVEILRSAPYLEAICEATAARRRRNRAKRAHHLETRDYPMVTKVNLADKLSLFNDHWHPRIVGDLNDSYVKLTKLKGEFVWHSHEQEDEMFLVVQGQLVIRVRDQEDVVLNDGEFVIIPRGVEHQPFAPEEVHVLLLEPKTTLNTGNVVNERTRAALERL